LTLFNVFYSAIPPMPCPRAIGRHSHIGDAAEPAGPSASNPKFANEGAAQ
jgi:hypothetical protein